MVRRYGMKAVSLIASVCLVFGILTANPARVAAQDSRELEVDAVAARSNNGDGKTRLDLYTRLPYSALQFLAAADGFQARYEVAIQVHELADGDRAGNLVQTRVWEQVVRVPDFARTQTDQLFDRTIQSIELEPAAYLIEFQVDDKNSSTTLVRELAVDVRDLSQPVAIGDLILIDAYDAEANSITPTVSNRIGSDQESIRLFYEIYSDRPRDVRVSQEVVRVRKSSGPPSVKSLLGFGGSEQVSNAEVTYQESTPRTLRSGRNQYVVEIPLKDFRVGEYVVSVILRNERGAVIDRAEKPVSLQWTGLADHVRDLDDAIAQLSYIAKNRDVEYIESGSTEDERLRRFREFWKRRDPTPGTERNERMEEYYYRIAYANRQYGNFGEGWKTDRGYVMVLFGEPDYIDRHPFNFNVKPYEIWYYEQIGRRFIFIDETGLGDYELLVPYWDERTRLR